MKYTMLGKSDLKISRICMGCMSFGRPGWLNWDWIINKAGAEPFFKKAVELGINFFDTADSYSDGESENITGKWLNEYAKRDDVIIATKHFFSKGETKEHIIAACEASLERLGIGTIDLYQIHRLLPGASMENALDALDSLVRQGKVRNIGVSSIYAWKLMKALAYSDQNNLARFVSVQNLYNLLYREEEREMQPLCEEENLCMIPWSPLARGILARGSISADATERSSEDPLLKTLASGASAEIAYRAKETAEKHNVKPALVSLAWLFSANSFSPKLQIFFPTPGEEFFSRF